MLGGNYATGEKPRRWDIVTYCGLHPASLVVTPDIRGFGLVCRGLPLIPGGSFWSAKPQDLHLVERHGFWKRRRLKRWHRRTS